MKHYKSLKNKVEKKTFKAHGMKARTTTLSDANSSESYGEEDDSWHMEINQKANLNSQWTAK